MIPKEKYVSGDNFGARLGIDFSKEEVTAFLENLGYVVKEVSGAARCRTDGMYDDSARFEELHVKRTIAYHPGDTIPERMDDDVLIYQMGLQYVFLYELKKKLLAL